MITNEAFLPRAQRVSTQLFYMLVLLSWKVQRRACWNTQVTGEGLMSWHRLVHFRGLFAAPSRCNIDVHHSKRHPLFQRRQMLISSPKVGLPQREWQSKASTNPTNHLLHWSVLRLRLLGDGGAAVFDVRCMLSLAKTSDRTTWRDCNSDIHL